MSDKTKKILIIIIFTIVVIVIGYGIWIFFFKPVFRPAVPIPPTITPPVTGLPPSPIAPPERIPITPPTALERARPSPVASGGLTQVNSTVSDPILSPSLSSNGKSIQYYNRQDGKFYRLDEDGRIEELSDKVFFNISKVSWAPDPNKAILEYPDGANIYYNFQNKEQVTLPRHWQDFNFSPDSNEIAFLSMGEDYDSRWLATSSYDGSGTKPIEPLGDNGSKVQVAWSPNNQMVAFSKTGSPQAINEQEILLIGKHHENFRSLKVNGLGFSGKWSPDGEKILFSTSSNNNDWKPQIWITDGQTDSIGARKRPLGLNTWVEKCAFSDKETIYCAVPETLERGIGIYPAAIGNTPDRLWKVNITTGQREIVAVPSESYTIGSIVVSDDESILYFTDAISGNLYTINLR